MAKTSSLINIGKVIEQKLAKIGIDSAENFLAKDPYLVFHELLVKVDPTLCRCALASIVGAKLGVPWHKIHKQSADYYTKKFPKHTWGNQC